MHLRAFTKTFAIPGIRMGYMVCGDRELTAEVRKHLPEWNISAIAERIGIAAAKVISGTGYLEKSNAAIARERSYLEKGLRELGIRVYPSDTNYLLLRQEEWLHDRVRRAFSSEDVLITTGWMRAISGSLSDGTKIMRSCWRRSRRYSDRKTQ